MVAKSGIYSTLFCPVKKNKQCPKTLEVGGDITHDPKLIAQQFCDHFSTIALTLFVPGGGQICPPSQLF